MKLSRLFAVPVLAVICLAGANTRAAAQISINIGVAPVCPYGYFNYAPYQCAPFGYYGPEWFTGGVFSAPGPGSAVLLAFTDTSITDLRSALWISRPVPCARRTCRLGHATAAGNKQWHGNREEHIHHDNGNHYGQYKDHDDHGKGHDDE